MLRVVLGIALGFALAALLRRADPMLVAQPDRRADTKSGAASAVVVEIEEQVGIPPSIATQIPPRDSLPARRQALERTVRDLLRNPPEVAPRLANPDAARQFHAELAAALQGNRP